MSIYELQIACVLLLLFFQVFCSIQAFYLVRGQLHIQDKVSNSLGQTDFYPPNFVFKIQRKHPSPWTSCSQDGVWCLERHWLPWVCLPKGFFLPPVGFSFLWLLRLGFYYSLCCKAWIKCRFLLPSRRFASLMHSVLSAAALMLLNRANMLKINVLILIYSMLLLNQAKFSSWDRAGGQNDRSQEPIYSITWKACYNKLGWFFFLNCFSHISGCHSLTNCAF